MHLIVDALDLIVAVIVDTADIQDRDGAEEVRIRMVGRFTRSKLVWTDSAYSGELGQWAKQSLKRVIASVKRKSAHTFEVLLKR